MNASEIAGYLKRLFKDNWEEKFLFDGLKERELSYKDFFKAVINCSDKLKRLGLRKGDIVCLWLNNSLELAVLYFACLVNELIAVPIDPVKGKNDALQLLGEVDYKLVIYDKCFESEKKDIIDHIKMMQNANYFGDLLKHREDDGLNRLGMFDAVDYDGLFLCTFTSGSTGVPKGVMHNFKNLFLNSIAFGKKFDLGGEHVFYHNLPMTYMAGILNCLITPLVLGCKVVIGERFNVAAALRFWDFPVKYNANTFWFIPMVAAMLVKIDRGQKGIEYAKQNKILGLSATAPLTKDVQKAFEEKYGIELYASYGLSETLINATNSPHSKILGSAGKLVEGTKLEFASDGEIVINVPWMFLGYINVESESCLKDGKFFSGDIGEIRDDFLYITDRKKDLIIRGGINLSPKKIQDFCKNFGTFDGVVVLGIKDEDLGEKVVCFYVPNTSFDVEKQKMLGREIVEGLGRDYNIDEFFKLDSIPLNINGKTDKLRIREIYRERK